MRFADVVRLLDNKTDLPIKPMDVARILLEGGIREEIIFVGVDINADILRGKLVQVTTSFDGVGIAAPYSYQSSGMVSKVYYALKQEDDVKGLSIIKELLHIVDPPGFETATREQVEHLLQTVVTPSELFVLGRENGGPNLHHVLLDTISDWRAIVALVPQRHWQALYSKFCEGKLSISEISRLIGAPDYYTRVVMSAAWPDLRKRWLNI